MNRNTKPTTEMGNTMNERYLLELIAAGRLSVDEAMSLMGKAEPRPVTKAATSAAKQKRNKHTQRQYSIDDHFRIIEAWHNYGQSRSRVRKALGIPNSTIECHLQYAGLMPCRSDFDRSKVENWRKRRGMYLTKPIEMRPSTVFGRVA